MGVTDKHAVDPNQAQKAAAAAPAPLATQAVSGNVQRVAARIPTRDVQFEKPKRVSPSKPEYPATLKAQNLEGDVVVGVDIAANGVVTQVSILRSSGHAAFDDAARRAALAERFTPALRDGQAVAFTLSYTYRFRIED
jgi:protein TonB